MRIEPETGVKFDNVAGIDEAKEVKRGNKCMNNCQTLPNNGDPDSDMDKCDWH